MRRILEFVERQGAVTAEQIRQEFFVSLPTIYRDLRELMRQNLLMQENGRFQRTREQTVTTSLDFRGGINIAQKKAIAAEAAKLVRDHSVIFIDASTTANQLIEHLSRFKDLTILTNGLATAMHLKQAGLRAHCVGGALVDRVCEPLMAGLSDGHWLVRLLGSGKGSGAALLFLIIAGLGVGACLVFRWNKDIRALDRPRQEGKEA